MKSLQIWKKSHGFKFEILLTCKLMLFVAYSLFYNVYRSYRSAHVCWKTKCHAVEFVFVTNNWSRCLQYNTCTFHSSCLQLKHSVPHRWFLLLFFFFITLISFSWTSLLLWNINTDIYTHNIVFFFREQEHSHINQGI